MKTLRLTTLLLGLALVFGSTSCKYEEGPGISLRTKKARVVGEWEIEKTIDSDGDVDEDWDGFKTEFKDDNTGETTVTSTFGGVSSTQTFTFTWEFSDNKEKLKITNDGEVSMNKILRLTNKEMWIEDEDGDQTNFKAL